MLHSSTTKNRKKHFEDLNQMIKIDEIFCKRVIILLLIDFVAIEEIAKTIGTKSHTRTQVYSGRRTKFLPSKLKSVKHDGINMNSNCRLYGSADISKTALFVTE